MEVRQRFKVMGEENIRVPGGSFRTFHIHCEDASVMSVVLDCRSRPRLSPSLNHPRRRPLPRSRQPRHRRHRSAAQKFRRCLRRRGRNSSSKFPRIRPAD
jgi:hypothetical protein